MHHVRRLSTAAHVAFVEHMTGEGALILPMPERDVRLDHLSPSLHEADLEAILVLLDSTGFEPSTDDNGEWITSHTTADGLEVVGLYGRDPTISVPTIEEQADAWQELRALIG